MILIEKLKSPKVFTILFLSIASRTLCTHKHNVWDNSYLQGKVRGWNRRSTQSLPRALAETEVFLLFSSGKMRGFFLIHLFIYSTPALCEGLNSTLHLMRIHGLISCPVTVTAFKTPLTLRLAN